MVDVSEGLREAIVEAALAPWPQARFLMMVGLMAWSTAYIPRADDQTTAAAVAQ